jgi:ribosomal-protein-alanine N-acetyltransferase
VFGVNLELFDRFPELETERLRLRELLDNDSPSLFEMFRDDEVTRYYDVETMTDATAAETVIARMQQRYRDRTGIRWAVVDKVGGTFLGTIGFNSINLFAHRAVLGYELARQVWGRGFATEAVRAVVRFGHDQVGVNRIEAAVMLPNEASARVLRKVGFDEEGVLRSYGHWKGRYHDLRMFSILRVSH